MGYPERMQTGKGLGSQGEDTILWNPQILGEKFTFFSPYDFGTQPSSLPLRNLRPSPQCLAGGCSPRLPAALPAAPLTPSSYLSRTPPPTARTPQMGSPRAEGPRPGPPAPTLPA